MKRLYISRAHRRRTRATITGVDEKVIQIMAYRGRKRAKIKTAEDNTNQELAKG